MRLNQWTEPPSWSTPLQDSPKYLTLFQLRLAIYLFSFSYCLDTAYIFEENLSFASKKDEVTEITKICLH